MGQIKTKIVFIADSIFLAITGIILMADERRRETE